ncbi:MDR family MFS transporter [Paenibacillus chartarius]|uniref:MDR family MFS transporter n=1 Tax=Paenibacillus chartarius TaxID=747481 RepID=A0ABV6DQP1_9BACL
MELSQQKTMPFGPIMLAIVCGSFLAILGISTINVALPVLMEDFGSPLNAAQWTLTGFMLATGIVAPLCGYLSDKFSAKLVYGISLLGFTLMSMACALAWNMESLIAFRILQGAFSGIVMPTTMTIIYQVIPRERQAFALSLWSLCAMLAPAIGPTLAGWLVERFDWRWLFYINIPFGVLATLLAFRLIPFYRVGRTPSFDGIGFVTALAASTALLLAFSEGNTWGWASIQIVGLIAFGFVMLGAFIWRELTTEHPLLNLSVFKEFRYTLSLILSCIVTISLYSGTYLTPLFLQNIQRLSAMDTGLILLPASLAMAACMPLTGALYKRVGPVALIVSGVILMGVGTYAMGHLHLDTSKAYIMFWMAVRNVGISLATMPATNAGMEVIPRVLSGHASSANNWIRQGFGSFSIGLFTSLLVARMTVHSAELAKGAGNAAAPDAKQAALIQAQSFTSSVNDVYFVATVIVLLALPLTFLLLRRKQPAALPVKA